MFAAPPPPRDLTAHLWAARTNLQQMHDALSAAKPDIRKSDAYAAYRNLPRKQRANNDAEFLTREVNGAAYMFGSAMVVSAGYDFDDDIGRVMFDSLAAMTAWHPISFHAQWLELLSLNPAYPAHRWGNTVPPQSRGLLLSEFAAALAGFYVCLLNACFEDPSQRDSHIQQMYVRLNQELIPHGMLRLLAVPKTASPPARPSSTLPAATFARPEPALIRDPHDAERLAAAWMRHWGYTDARELPVGPDGGIDVDSTGAVAQVKAHMRPIGRPDVQNLYGVATSLGKTPVFFSLTAYTREAEQWADKVGVALFRFDLQGEPEPANHVAEELLIRLGDARPGGTY